MEGQPISKQFEHFVAYCALAGHYVGRVNFENVVTDDKEAGIDSVAFIIDEEVLTTPDEADIFFSGPRRNREVEIIFTQATTTEAFERAKITSFADAVIDFFRAEPLLPQGEVLQNARDIFTKVLDNVQKIKEGRPICSLFFASAGIWQDASEQEASMASAKLGLEQTGLFLNVAVKPLDRDMLIDRWIKSKQTIDARLDVRGYLPFPEIEGVTEAYVAIVSAKELVKKLILDPEGNIRTTVFQENVRAFLGEDNDVNDKIIKTLQDAQHRDRFCILNNGITVISPDIRVQLNTISLKDFQVVNGCQTSHVLARNYDLLGDSVMVTLKVIEATDEDILAEVVEATNSQTEVKRAQFFSRLPVVKKIEQYFDSFDAVQDREKKLYFERRDNQFAGQGIPDIRVFDIRTLARAYASVIIENPHLAARYPTNIFQNLAESLYQDDHQEVSYYTAALSYYRLQLFLVSGRLPGTTTKFKWHMLMGFKYLASAERTPQPNSRRMERYCASLQEALTDTPRALSLFQDVITVIESLGEVSRDRLKRNQFTAELRDALNLRQPRT
jgi:hypothetical protein